jgi:hypothetical protein
MGVKSSILLLEKHELQTLKNKVFRLIFEKIKYGIKSATKDMTKTGPTRISKKRYK